MPGFIEPHGPLLGTVIFSLAIQLSPCLPAPYEMKFPHAQYRSSKTGSGYIAVPLLDVTKEALEAYLQHPKKKGDPGFHHLRDLIETKRNYKPDRSLFVNPTTRKPFATMKSATEPAVLKTEIARITCHDIHSW